MGKKRRRSHLSQFGVVDEVRSVSVDEGTQGQAILPAEEEERTEELEDAEQKTEECKGVQRSTSLSLKKKKSRHDCSLALLPQSGAVDQPDVEVLHVDVPVGGSLPLAPQQQTLLCRGL